MQLLQNLIELIDSPAHRRQGSTTAIFSTSWENDVIVVADENQKRNVYQHKKGVILPMILTISDILNEAYRGLREGKLFFDNHALGFIFREVAAKINILEDEKQTLKFKLNRTEKEKNLILSQKNELENEIKVANRKIELLEQKCQEYEQYYIADTKILNEAAERIEELTKNCAEYIGEIKELEEKIESLEGESKKAPLSYWQIEIYGVKKLAQVDKTGDYLYIIGIGEPHPCSKAKFIKQIDLV